VFYSNLKITKLGNLYIEVNKKNIKITHSDWLTLTNLTYQGQKFSSSNIPKEFNYDRDMTLSFMIKQKMQDQNVKNVSNLNIKDRLYLCTY